MNIQEYISSGILEAYALGEVSQEERAMVDKLLAEYPEAKAELALIEDTLEALAMKAAVEPCKEVKETIMMQMRGAHPESKVVSLVPDALRSMLVYKYAAAASIAIALLTSYLAYDYRSRWIEEEIAFNQLSAQNRRVAEDYNVVNHKLDKIQGDFAIIESTAFQKVVMKGTPNDVNALASVYWNQGTKEVYISIQNLKDLAQEKQYQLWAIVDGKPVDAGVFDKNFAGLLKMKNVTGAAAFAVTVEPRGGQASPTLSTMQVVGALPATKS